MRYVGIALIGFVSGLLVCATRPQPINESTRLRDDRSVTSLTPCFDGDARLLPSTSLVGAIRLDRRGLAWPMVTMRCYTMYPQNPSLATFTRFSESQDRNLTIRNNFFYYNWR